MRPADRQKLLDELEARLKARNHAQLKEFSLIKSCGLNRIILAQGKQSLTSDDCAPAKITFS